MFEIDETLVHGLVELSLNASPAGIARAIDSEHPTLEDFAALISPNITTELLKKLAQRSYELTRMRFGRAISLYVPLYYDNRCVNGCIYCGFNVHNKIPRKKLTFEEIVNEAEFLRAKNFKNLLLVAGEHPESANVDFLVDVIKKMHEIGFSCLSIEIAPLATEDYARLVSEAHLDGLYVYQETFNKELYSMVHPSGRKRDYSWRLGTPERGAEAGISKIGVGFLLGLNDFREDALYLACNIGYLQKNYWKSEYSISYPRIRNAAGVNSAFRNVSDRDFLQLVCAYRLLFPEIAMSVSTREYPEYRDRIIPLAFTSVSAGSSTAPGGYCNKNKDLEQFEVEDSRSVEEVTEALRKNGFDPVWKDWE